MKTRRVTFPLEGFNLSGGIRIILQIANGLAERNHRVRIIVPDYAASPPFALHDSVDLVVVRTFGSKAIRKTFYIAHLCLIATRDSDLCFATGYRTPYYLCIAKCLSLSRARIVYLIQHYEPLSHARYKKGLWKLLLPCIAKAGYRLPLKKIAVSNWVREQVGDETASVIGNGIDLSRFRPESDTHGMKNDFTIGTIASPTEWKGFRVFLNAICDMPTHERRSITVLIASQDPVELPPDVSATVVKPSNDEELVSFYRSCSVFVCTSWIEGFGLPALEAMACGAALITTKCGGVSQYANRTNSLMVRPGDSKAIAASIIALRKDRDFVQLLRRQGLKTARMFSLEKMTNDYCDFVSSI